MDKTVHINFSNLCRLQVMAELLQRIVPDGETISQDDYESVQNAVSLWILDLLEKVGDAEMEK